MKVPRVPSVPVPVADVLGRSLRRTRTDYAGWSAPELLAHLGAPRGITPPRRAGHAAVRLTNSLGAVLPIEATLLARAVADAAPPVGQEISVTLSDIVERHLPDTLTAFRGSGAAVRSERGRTLVTDQLRLLHRVTKDVLRAEAEHDDHELRVQQRFLDERFGRPARNGLDLPAAVPPVEPDPIAPAPSLGDARATSAHSIASSQTSAHHRLLVETSPTAVFNPDGDSDGQLTMRLALSKGIAVTLTGVLEKQSGETGFVTSVTRRFAARRKQAAFGAAQVDVGLTVPLHDTRRFILLATSRSAGEPAEALAFLREGATSSAELPTLLARCSGAQTTLVASGHDTSDGLFVRNESTVFGSLREACDAYGFTRITWLAPDTPAV